MILAHRGMGKGRYENTINSFKEGLDYGADGIEFDVRLTKDLEVVLNHDPTLKRTRDLDTVVGEHTLFELEEMGLTGDDGIATIEEIFNRFPTDKYFDIELKDPGTIEGLTHDESVDILIDKTLETIRRHGAVERCMISSFAHEFLSKVKNIMPDIVIGTLIDKELRGQGAREFLLDTVEKYRPEYLNLDQRMFNNLGMDKARKILEEVRSKGVKIAFWTLNDPELFNEIRNLCDVVITDVSDIMVKTR